MEGHSNLSSSAGPMYINNHFIHIILQLFCINIITSKVFINIVERCLFYIASQAFSIAKKSFFISLIMIAELPWDQPSALCAEYVSWCEGSVAGAGPWRSMGPVLLSLLRRLLHPQPLKRPTLQAVRDHPWLSDQNGESAEYTYRLLHRVAIL